MPIEGIPRTDWKPFQREVMRGWERLWTRDDHWLRIEKWKIRQQHTPDWVCLAQIADWCARRPGDIERDHRRRVQAYSDLQQSIMLGEFGEGSRLKVVYLEPQPPSLRDRVRLRLHTGYSRTERCSTTCSIFVGHLASSASVGSSPAILTPRRGSLPRAHQQMHSRLTRLPPLSRHIPENPMNLHSNRRVLRGRARTQSTRLKLR
jgi:hypothetical protein